MAQSGISSTNNGDWESHRRLIHHDLQSLHERDRELCERIEALSRSMIAVRMELSSQKVKTGLIGLVGGMIPIVIALALALLQNIGR